MILGATTAVEHMVHLETSARGMQIRHIVLTSQIHSWQAFGLILAPCS